MKAVDTNILVRYLVRDDEEQARIADTLLVSDCLLTPSVLLETVWLLASHFRLQRGAIADALAQLIRLPRLVTENDALFEWAIGRFRAGADFADMIHLLTGRAADAFATFDRRLARQAGPSTPLPVELAL